MPPWDFMQFDGWPIYKVGGHHYAINPSTGFGTSSLGFLSKAALDEAIDKVASHFDDKIAHLYCPPKPGKHGILGVVHGEVLGGLADLVEDVSRSNPANPFSVPIGPAGRRFLALQNEHYQREIRRRHERDWWPSRAARCN